VEALSRLDWAVLALLALAALRGLAIGVVREAFSLGALGAAIVAVRVLGEPAGHWLARALGLGELPALILAGAALAAAGVTGVALIGGVVRRGLHAAGLGLWDRLAGGLLGAAEGALAAALLVLGGTFALGHDHPLLADSRSVEAFEQLQELAQGGSDGAARDVAAPPPRS
jgi:uncharacterized membrane protein required for colicin V production